jgi:hypothetical protein
MIKITTINRILMSIALLTTLSITSCKKDNFDEPPHEITDPNIANTTIAELRSLFTSGNPITVTDDIIIGGVVTADDRTGNFYKQFIIQDSTGAIPVLINKSGLYTDYPVGRKVYIKCKGLVLGLYGNNLQLGGYIDYTGAQPSVGNIASALTNDVVVKGPFLSAPAPKPIARFSDLNFTTDQSILIELDPVEFMADDANQAYADVVNEASLSRNIKDCYGDIIAIRTSNYASFANSLTPSAGTKLKIIGVYSVFNSTRQLAIRSVTEVQTSTTPCGVDPALPTISIADLKALYTTVGLPMIINSDSKISGIVTANDRSGNFYKQIVIQDATGAIPILINKKELYKQFEIGRRIYVSVNGLVIGQYGKNIQLGGYVDSSSATPAVGDLAEALIPNRILNGALETPIVPRKISSFADLNLTTDQSTLVELDPVSFQSSSVGRPFADIANGTSLSRNISDCDNNTLAVRTSNFAEFANQNTPSGSLKIVGIYSIFNTSKQLAIREISEVATSTTTCPAVPVEVVLFSENFNGVSTSGNLAISGWTNFSTAGTKYWYGTGSSTNKNARVSAYNSGQTSNVAWLITPSINLDGSTGETLNFSTNIYQPAGATILEVLYSSDYSGSGNPSTATWNVLGSVPNVTTAWSAATPISLNSISGNIYIAFRYTGGDPGNTTQYNIDDVSVSYFE